MLDLRVSLDQPALQDNPVKMAILDKLENKVLGAKMVSQVPQGHQVLTAIRGNRAKQVYRVHQVLKDLRVRRVTQEPQEQQAPLVRQEIQAQ